MPYAVPVKVAAKTNIILRLVEADADGVDEESHATKLQLTKAKLGTKLLDVMERFARHHNRRCAEGERVEASRLDASDREGPLDVQVPVGNLLNPLDSSEQTLDITLRRAQTDEEIAREAPADPSEFQPSPTFEGYRPGMVFKRGFFGQGYYKDKLWTDIEAKKAEQAEDAALYDAAAAYDGPREGFVFTTRELGTGYYKDRPPPMFDPNAQREARGQVRKGTCEMTINVKIVKALKLGVVKRKHQWGDGLLKGK
ncbi:hypothetical protein SO694_001060106 [Aureococcus anophagefferens]|uniref:Uncharacterized protein n=1 Tax=Aureococcus anophagefferens TaxID=44056 RepID=A0ABR1FMP2_AURAN